MPTTARVLAAAFVLGGVATAGSIEFSGAFAERAAQIVKRPTVHTSTAWEPVDADGDLFAWFIDHPTAAASLWKELGLEVGSVELLPDGWRSRDPDGAVLEFHRLHHSTNSRAYYCKATVPTGAVPRTVTAEFVLIHDLRQVADPTGGHAPVDRIEAWASAEGAALRAIMKLANGAATSAVAKSLRETKRYFALIAKIAERRAQWAKAALAKRPWFLSDEDLTEFESRLARATARPRAAATATRPTARQMTR